MRVRPPTAHTRHPAATPPSSARGPVRPARGSGAGSDGRPWRTTRGLPAPLPPAPLPPIAPLPPFRAHSATRVRLDTAPPPPDDGRTAGWQRVGWRPRGAAGEEEETR